MSASISGALQPVVLGEPGAQHLARVIPFVERRVDVEPFVALQANELGAGKLRHHFRSSFSRPALALDEQRLSHFAPGTAVAMASSAT